MLAPPLFLASALAASLAAQAPTLVDATGAAYPQSTVTVGGNTFALSLACALLAVPAAAQELPHAFVGARVLPISGAPIEDGVVVMQFGRIRAVGARSAVEVPSGAKVIDVIADHRLRGTGEKYAFGMLRRERTAPRRRARLIENGRALHRGLAHVNAARAKVRAFVHDFAHAWRKVMELDRFDLR